MNPLLPRSFWPSVHRVLAGGQWPPDSPEAARRLIEGCGRHGILPLLLAEDDLPPTLKRALDAAAGWRRILEMRAARFHEATEAVCGLFADDPVLLIKGADYAHRIYPNLVLRPMQDVDFLVPADRLDQACDRLARAGLRRVLFTPVQADPAYHERIFAMGKLVVEVHDAFIQRPRHRIDYEEVWRRRVPLAVGAQPCFRLDDVDAVAYHALSMAIDEFRVRLIRYVDLWLLLRQREGLALAAAERAREWQSARSLYGALSLACRVFPDFRSEDVREAMARVVPAPTARLLDRLVLPPPSALGRRSPTPPVVRYWRKAALMDGTGRRLAFALFHARAVARGWSWRAKRGR